MALCCGEFQLYIYYTYPWHLMKTIWKELPSSHAPFFLCRKRKLSNTWGHSSCSGIHPVPSSPVTTLTDFCAQARNIQWCGDKQLTTAHYMEILCGAWMTMTVLHPPCCLCMLWSWLGIRWQCCSVSYSSTTVISVSTLSTKICFRALLTSQLGSDKHFFT